MTQRITRFMGRRQNSEGKRKQHQTGRMVLGEASPGSFMGQQTIDAKICRLVAMCFLISPLVSKKWSNTKKAR